MPVDTQPGRRAAISREQAWQNRTVARVVGDDPCNVPIEDRKPADGSSERISSGLAPAPLHRRSGETRHVSGLTSERRVGRRRVFPSNFICRQTPPSRPGVGESESSWNRCLAQISVDFRVERLVPGVAFPWPAPPCSSGHQVPIQVIAACPGDR